MRIYKGVASTDRHSTERRLFLFKGPAGSPERNDIEDLAITTKAAPTFLVIHRPLLPPRRLVFFAPRRKIPDVL